MEKEFYLDEPPEKVVTTESEYTIDEEPTFEVDEILQQRLNKSNNTVEYLVKWKFEDQYKWTWSRAEDFNADDRLEGFK